MFAFITENQSHIVGPILVSKPYCTILTCVGSVVG